jgi:hypothetical protein
MIHTREGQNATALIENGIPLDISNVVEQMNHTVEKTKEWFADHWTFDNRINIRVGQ